MIIHRVPVISPLPFYNYFKNRTHHCCWGRHVCTWIKQAEIRVGALQYCLYVIRATTLGHMLCVGHCTKPFRWVISLNSNNLTRWVVSLPRGNWELMRLSCLPKVTHMVDSRATLETAWLLQILAYVTQHTRCDLLAPFPCHLCVKEKCSGCLFSNHWILSILALEIQKDPIVKKAF